MNKKRHSLLKRQINRGFIIAVGLLTGTCAPTPKPVTPATYSRQTPAIEQPSAAPTIEGARAKSSEADAQATAAAQTAARLSLNLSNAQSELRAVTASAMRLANQKAATAVELMDLYNRLVEQERKFAVMVADNASLEISLSNERKLRADVTAALVKAQAEVVAKDGEASKLRGQLATAETNAENNNKLAISNGEAAIAARESVKGLETTSELQTKWLWILGAGCAISLLGNAIFVYLRLKP